MIFCFTKPLDVLKNPTARVVEVQPFEKLPEARIIRLV